MENGNVSVLVGFEEIEINLKIRTGFEWRIWSGISCTLLYIKKCLWVGSFGVKWHESPFKYILSKSAKGKNKKNEEEKTWLSVSGQKKKEQEEKNIIIHISSALTLFDPGFFGGFWASKLHKSFWSS